MKIASTVLQAVKPKSLRYGTCYHPQLEPKLWMKNGKLNQLASNALQMAAWDYIAFMQNAGISLNDSDIIDIFIHGSTTNYYYDESSDIDICIVANLDNMQSGMPGCDLHAIAKAMQNSWMRKNIIKIYGRGIDITIVDVRSPKYGPNQYKVGSAYSLPGDEWIHKPIKLTQTQIRDIRRQARIKYKEFVKLYRRLARNKMNDTFIDTMIGRLWFERRNAYAQSPQQPITPDTMAFRMIRRHGVLQHAKSRMAQLRSKNFNLTI